MRRHASRYVGFRNGASGCAGSLSGDNHLVVPRKKLRSIGENPPDSTVSDTFPARLSLALQALNFSRAQLSAAVGVDKSLVSRWLSGQMAPTSHNLARISETLASRKPGFNMTLWTTPRADFEAFLGVSPPVPPDPAAAAATERRDRELQGPTSRVPRFHWRIFAGGGVAILVLALSYWLWSGPSAYRAEPGAAVAGSIAVLPLANISGDARQKYFSDGVTDELITTLAKVRGLRVAARTSSFAFAGKNVDVRKIARALHVRSILEGNVRQDGDRVRIEIQLVNASDGFQQWSRSYDRDLKNILRVQDEIAQSVARILSPSQSQRQKGWRQPVEIVPAVYRKYLQAESVFATRTPQGTTRALDLLREITRDAPDFADGFAARAYTLLSAVSRHAADAKTEDEFQSSLSRALALDPTNPQALAVQIEYESSRLNWDTVIADAVILRRLYPHNSTALHGLVTAYQTLGLTKLALSTEREAARLDPLSYIARRRLGTMLDDLGRFNEGIAVLKSSLEVQPGQPSAMAELCFAYADAGRIGEAKSVLAELSLPGMPVAERKYCTMGIALNTHDIAISHAFAEELAANYRQLGAQEDDVAKVFATVGEHGRAMDWFERAYDRHIFFFNIDGDVIIPKALFATSRWMAMTRRPAFQRWRAASTRARKLFSAAES
jgi:TolB-like protein/tetratricopeptide (TPR) repeat protein/transcriptional regulator with XRE-family HTH domain